MAELPITINAIAASMQTSNQSNASRPSTNEAAGTGLPAATPTSFAATLKSLAEKKPDISVKDEKLASIPALATEAVPATIAPITPLTPEASDSAEASITSIDSSALLSVLQADATLAQALMTPASAASPAPTFPPTQEAIEKSTLTTLSPVLATDPTVTGQPLIPKFATQAASSAESRQEVTVNLASGQAQENFSTILERVTNHPTAGLVHSPTAETFTLSPTLELPVEIRLGQTAWRDEVGQKLTWMVSNNQQHADLVLNPPQLGRIEVSLSLDGNQASASFTSPHAAVREALESAMTRLRDVLADAGVTLGQTHVGSESRRDSNPMHSKNEGFLIMRQQNDRHVAALDSPEGRFPSRGIRMYSMVDIFA
jgi:flagellar hook-length control protein FliK